MKHLVFRTYSTIFALTISAWQPKMVFAQNQAVQDRWQAHYDSILNNQKDKSLSEVIVVGYGTQKRTHLTGSVTKISSEVFQNYKTSTVDEALGGAAAGVNVTTGGQPGAGSQIRIRGGNSVNANNAPLYVIDGFIYYHDASSMQTGVGAIESALDPLSFINPSDIEHIEVLKDDGATAIYGSRGANGVIIITTKKGQRGKNSVRYSTNATLSTAAKKLHLLDAREWAQLQKDYFGNKVGYSDEEIAQLGHGTDWQDAVLRSAWSQTHEISFSGGDNKTRYQISGNYTNQDGIVIGSDFSRYNLRANVERQLSDKFLLSVVATAGKTRQHALSTTEPVNYKSSPYSAGITNSLTYALFMPPVVPIYNADGTYNYTNPYENSFFSIGGVSANPVSDLNNTTAESINNYTLLNAFLKYNFNDFLSAKLSVGADLTNITQNYFAPSYTALGLNEHGVGSIGHRDNEATQTELLLTYNRQLSASHLIDALAGYTFQKTETEYNKTTVSHFTNETLGHHNLSDGSQVYTPQSGYSDSRLHSLIARANYTLLERYNATATLRADHSSRFAKSHRWGWFPSLGLSWNVNHEPFFSPASAISTLKVRASYGVTGNQEIGDYEYAARYSASSYGGSTAYTRSNLGNEDLKWETTSQLNFGIDLGLFEGRLNLVADLYAKKTSDLLLTVPVNSSTGTGAQLKNVGNVSNRGLELTLSATPIKRKQLTWNVGANLSFNKNELTKMGNGLTQLTSGENTQYILKEGESVGSFYGLIFDGVDPETGAARFRDVSGADGTPDGKINSYDRVVLGSYHPDFFYGFSSSLKWKQWDFSLSFKGSQGGKAFNSLRRSLEMASASYNTLSYLLSSWTSEHTLTDYPKITGTYQSSYIDSRYVENASYLKLKHLTVGYTFKLPRLVNQIRLYAQGSNLLTLTKYKGYDPELNEGRDLGAYPTARSFTLGAEITF
ncbi:MAG: TonB-dependent receptor [Bacteroidaceae bacterium]|nr:TonB-dependent receptor [Bacteroidaceae bacterium]